MKKLILSIAIAAIATLGANAQVSFGIQAGANLASLKSEFTSGGTKTKEKGKTKVGFVAGVVANIPFSSSLSFRPELNFIQKGGKFSSTNVTGPITSTDKDNFTLNFVELPLNIVFSLPAGPGRFCVGAGPNISYGLSGKDKYSSTSSGQGFPTQSSSGTTKIKFDGDENSTDPNIHFKALDFGANAFVGYKMDMGLFLNVGYTYGFSNLNPNPNSSLKTAGLFLKVGFAFGGQSTNTED
jgi:Outer membrane protein beta-barrel domain